MVSSSFSDEFVGRLFLDLGPTEFMRRIGNDTMEPVVRGLVDETVVQRMHQQQASTPSPARFTVQGHVAFPRPRGRARSTLGA